MEFARIPKRESRYESRYGWFEFKLGVRQIESLFLCFTDDALRRFGSAEFALT